ncbi:MAG: PIN domain-containing protein [bacterium]|nr:PIN domain-containing protein [bacterium]
MSDNPERCFIDTNIWLYAFVEGEEPEKTREAKHVIDTEHDIVLSTQVVNEMAVNLLRNADMTEEHIRELIADLYKSYLVVELNQRVQLKASELREQHHFSFWDSTIVANALFSEAHILYSEDMQDGCIVCYSPKTGQALKVEDFWKYRKIQSSSVEVSHSGAAWSF